jgi:hypothetical protein
LYSSEGRRPKYIHVQEGENIQITPWRNTIIEKANIYLILWTTIQSGINQIGKKDRPEFFVGLDCDEDTYLGNMTEATR